MKKLLKLLLISLVILAGVFLGRQLMLGSVPSVVEVESFLDTLPGQTGWKQEGDPYAGVIVSPKPRSWEALRNLLGFSVTPNRKLIHRYTSDGRLVAITLYARDERITKVQVSAPLDPLLALKAKRLLVTWFPDLNKVF